VTTRRVFAFFAFAFVFVLVVALVFALILVLDFFIECSSEAGPDGDRLALVVMGKTD
jgi:hypothetical protein